MSTSGRDLLFQDDVRDAVARAYRAIPHGAGRAVAERCYSADELAQVPERAITWALGVGNPVRYAAVTPGETVLDLGCGGGIDMVLAARRVGAGGRVVGLDLLPEMADRSRAAVREAGVAGRCEVEVGLMEDIPLPDASVDVVVANGVLNLSPRTSRVLAEVARVLVPGGRLCAADLTVDRDLPGEVLASEAAWAGCIAGAVSERVLAKQLARAGLGDVEMGHRRPFGLDDVAQYPLFTPAVLDLMRRTLSPDARHRVAVSLVVHAALTQDHEVGEPRPRKIAAASGATPLSQVAPDAVEAPGVAVRHLKRVDDVELKILDVDAGGSTPYHTHLHAHQGVVVSGHGTLRLADRVEPLGPGDVFAVNPTDWHAIRSDADEPLRFACMDCFLEDG